MLDRTSLLLYAVTDRAWTGALSLYEQVELALSGGVSCVQLREKQLSADDFIREAKCLLPLCHRYGAPLIINDSLSVALAADADGVHVGQEDLSAAEVRKAAGSGFIIGTTAKTVLQAQAAEAGGADYLGVGAVFPSPTKKNAVRITHAQLKEICASVSIPAVAIGGITLENMTQLAGSGAAGFAVVSAVFGAADIRASAQSLRAQAAQLI